jgi:hypothetical protein
MIKVIFYTWHFNEACGVITKRVTILHIISINKM